MRKTIYILLTGVILTSFACSGSKETEQAGSGKTAEKDESTAFSPIVADIKGNRGFDSSDFAAQPVFDLCYRSPEKANLVYFENNLYDIYIERYLGSDLKNVALIEIKDLDLLKGIGSAQVKAFVHYNHQLSDTLSTLYFEQEGRLNIPADTSMVSNIQVKEFNFNPASRTCSIDLSINGTEAHPMNSTKNPSAVRLTYKGTLNSANIVY